MKTAREIMLNPPFFIAGPCSIASADKANRSNANAWRGIGWREGLRAIKDVSLQVGIPTITDVHEVWQVNGDCELGLAETGAVYAADALQIPANLCRQTDLIQTAAATGAPLLIKKGTWMPPDEIIGILGKAYAVTPTEGNGYGPFAICERGFAFGYGHPVVDMTVFQALKDPMSETPVVFDCTHSSPSRDFAPALAAAAVATGYVDGIFMEVHPNPDRAPCDGQKMIPTGQLSKLLRRLIKIWRIE